MYNKVCRNHKLDDLLFISNSKVTNLSMHGKSALDSEKIIIALGTALSYTSISLSCCQLFRPYRHEVLKVNLLQGLPIDRPKVCDIIHS